MLDHSLSSGESYDSQVMCPTMVFKERIQRTFNTILDDELLDSVKLRALQRKIR